MFSMATASTSPAHDSNKTCIYPISDAITVPAYDDHHQARNRGIAIATARASKHNHNSPSRPSVTHYSRRYAQHGEPLVCAYTCHHRTLRDPSTSNHRSQPPSLLAQNEWRRGRAKLWKLAGKRTASARRITFPARACDSAQHERASTSSKNSSSTYSAIRPADLSRSMPRHTWLSDRFETRLQRDTKISPLSRAMDCSSTTISTTRITKRVAEAAPSLVDPYRNTSADTPRDQGRRNRLGSWSRAKGLPDDTPHQLLAYEHYGLS